MEKPVNQLRWLPSFRSLSDEQRAAVNDALEGKALVYGPAGSGKTAIVLYRAKCLLDQGKSFRIFVFTKVLSRFITAGIQELGIPPESVQTFYSWVWREYKRQFGTTPPDEAGDEKYSAWTDALLKLFRTQPHRIPRCDYVLVDEAQDFKDNVAELIHLLSDNVFVAGDSSQSLYTDVSDMGDLARRWEPLDRPHQMIKNYRNPLAVARVAALFLTASPLSREAFLQSVQGRPMEMKPVWYQVASDEERTARIVDIIRQARGGASIGILFRHRERLHKEAQQLSQRGVRFQIALSDSREYDFGDVSIPTLTTIHSAKGIEFDWVILPDLDADVWDNGHDDPKERKAFFVAITRTKTKLYLISLKQQHCAYIQEILNTDACLIQCFSQPPQSTAWSDAREEDAGDDLPF